MSKKVQKFVFLIKVFAVLIIVFNFNAVNAATLKEGSYLTLSDYGLSGSNTGSHTRTSKKTVNGDTAYCIQFKLNAASSYSKCSLSQNAKVSLMSGLIMDIVSEKSWSSNKKYVYVFATLNTYFRKDFSWAASSNFYNNSTVASIYKEAQSRYKTANTSISKVKVSIADKDTDMALLSTSSDSNFISKKITVSNMETDHNGDKPEYVVTVSSGSGKAYICTDSLGKNCVASSKDVSGKTSASFYVKVTGGTAGDSVKVKVTGKTSKKYSIATFYCASGKQKLAVDGGDTVSKSSSTSASISLEMPEANKHKITIYKTDDNGEELSGASFELRAQVNGSSSNLTLTNSGNKFQYVTEYTTTENDDFYNTSYCIKETSAPSGYSLSADDQAEFCVTPTSSSSSVCYDLDGNDTGDLELCNPSDYKVMCKISDGNYSDVDETGVCSSSSTDTGSTDQTGQDEESSDNGEGATVESDEEVLNGSGATYEKVCIKGGTTEVDSKYCESSNNYIKVTSSSGNITYTKVNTKNSVTISKKALTGDDELIGAELKICTSSDYTTNGNNCSAAKNIDGVEMSWVSTEESAIWSGLTPGDYNIIETVAPDGYKLVDINTQFTIDSTGAVSVGGQTVSDNIVVINNTPTEMVISKTDIATGKELSGANLSICITEDKETGVIDETAESDEDDESSEAVESNEESSSSSDGESSTPKMLLDLDGYCIPAVLADGSDASWTSGDTEHKVVGLPAGTYYLVETVAPSGYSTAESIPFIMKSDGTVTDLSGKSLESNKLVMSDTQITEVKTGDVKIVFVILLAALSICVATYYFRKNKGNNSSSKTRIRKRKLHRASF